MRDAADVDVVATDLESKVSGGASFILGGGETGALLRSTDWRATRLGSPELWPQSLRTALSLCVNSRFPIALYWGPDFFMLYNDSLLPMVGANKHPGALGRPAFEVLPEIRTIIEPLLDHVRSTGEATWSEDLMLPLVRGVAAEESYFTFTYSPIHDEAGHVGGVFCAVIETTEKVIEDRRLRLLHSLAGAAEERTKEDACVRAATHIARYPEDVPFAVLYVLDESAAVAHFAGAAHVESGSPYAPKTIALDGAAPWPLVDGAPGLELRDAPSGARAAVVLPLERSGGGPPLGYLVVGLSPLLAKSPSYDRFHNLLASSIAAAVGNAAAYAEERKRAEALAELDRAKTTFFSNVSHEFRTPLTLMLASIQDLLASADGATIDRQTVSLLDRNAARLLKLVNTLLEFSRIEAGRVEAVYEPVDLAALTTDLASSFRAAVEKEGIAFDVACTPLTEPVYVDRAMWEKIVLNLVSNAFKFTFQGSITVRVALEGDAACLTVSDTGTGISEQELPRVFERFHQVEGARARSHEGSGIGLALIQELVRLHGGEIALTSAVGQGTSFQVRIPRGSAHLPAAHVHAARTRPPTAIGSTPFVDEAARWGATASAPSSSPGPHLSESRERIIFVDDNADMRDYVSRLLSERWTVEAFHDGSSALERARTAPPDLVLSDVMMPGIDGFALVQAMRADPTLRAIPIILLSARASEEEAGQGRDSGASDYIAKPFSARDLLVRIASNLANARATRALSEFERKQRANLYRHFMQAPFPVAVLKGPQHIVELANPGILQAWGKGSEALGKPLIEGVPELVGQPFLTYLDQVYRSGTPYEGREHQARLPTGRDGRLEELYYNFVYAPLRDPQDVIEGVLVSAFDVTPQVQARHELEEATVEREHALAEAQRASIAKDEFLSTMSHELRTPLSAIVGWANLLSSGTVSGDRIPHALATIERNARMQARLIEDMLDIARIEQGKLLLNVGPTDMCRVVEAALETVRPAAEIKGVRLQRVLDSNATIIGDPDRLQQVVWNLLSNAIKFTPKGRRVQVRLQRQHSYVELIVSDDGQGIEPSFLPHVFERFRQADGKFSRTAGGLGLGLAIVRAVVELHGGTITAESAGADQGATFTVRVPIAPLQATSLNPPPRSQSKFKEAPVFECPPSLVGLRILVVDDESDTRELLQFVLEQCGSTPTMAANAREGLAALKQGSFDILISDVGMPEVDGLEFIRRVRDLPARAGRSLPAIALTAYARTDDRTAALRAGFDTHLTKPTQPGELLVVIASLIEAVKRRSE